MPTGYSWCARAVALTVAVAALATTAFGVGSRPAAAADDGLRYEAETTYTVDIDGGVIRVEQNLVLGNELSDFFFPEIPVGVLDEAANFVATVDGQRVSVSREEIENELIAVLNVDIEPDLLPNQTRTVRLTYDLRSLPPRSDGFTRVNPAFATFAAFSPGDENLTRVTIRVPAGFEVEYEGAEIESEETVDGVTVLSSGPIADPSTWSLVVVARNDDGLLSRSLSVNDHALVVRAWPGDDEWGSFVEQTLADGVPVLEGLVGLEWPTEDELTIIEAASPYIYGYAGWFKPTENLIVVGDALDSQVILHELSHLWFNDALFGERWIGEAFAEEYAWRARAALGESPAGPDPIDLAAPGAGPLADWGQPSFTDESIRDRELYSYNASFSVLHTIVEEVGTEAMLEVLAAADTGAIAYLGDPEPETSDERVDSRRFLDLLEERTGATTAAAVFELYVLSADDAAMLAARTDARVRYAALVEAGAGWSPPLAVRRALARWNFPKADRLIETAATVIEERDEIAVLAGDLDLDVPPQFEELYENDETLEDTPEFADDLRSAADAIVAADATVEGADGLTERVGLLFDDADGALDDARAAFERGNPERAQHEAERAIAIVDDATSKGLVALVVGIGIVLIPIVVIIVVVSRRRRGRRPSVPIDPWVGSPQ